MFKLLLLLLIVVPAIEIWLMILIGGQIGSWNTLLLILLTAVAGAYLTKREASLVWSQARFEMENHRVPGRHLLDGICILIGGVLLLAPGFLTDAVGFLLIFPPTRLWFRVLLMRVLQKALSKGTIRFIHRR
ncbi:membrane protein FxsA [Xylanibacillus composti]|uniref:Membrane protein FxsA n=1 Tax=Xylanibacillus composti TaxID=1572762 RepID=A0A8J4M2H1_9BACL|nr:FxsA family protein [Xylanibacillus composti]MDT9724792.1 membrane protein FxsA [Xylanibacillus composti]GIQ69855.1 membrane protein FxsA [Xylanibacillus composti]